VCWLKPNVPKCAIGFYSMAYNKGLKPAGILKYDYPGRKSENLDCAALLPTLEEMSATN
jgi:hypothetical protein